jgi:hypothetical protein
VEKEKLQEEEEEEKIKKADEDSTGFVRGGFVKGPDQPVAQSAQTA